jgi:dCMP deaminase
MDQTRPSIDRVMLNIAVCLAQRATCYKLAVGCVLTDHDGRILSAGYNGKPKGFTHCLTNRCDGDVCLATHAETNALMSCRGMQSIHTCYTTHSPCMSCVKQLIQTNCRRIIYMHETPEILLAHRHWQHAGRQWFQYKHELKS